MVINAVWDGSNGRTTSLCTPDAVRTRMGQATQIDETSPMSATRELVLASGSRYRAALAQTLCTAISADLTVRSPQIDERELDPEFDPGRPERLALTLAERKARIVAADLPPDGPESPNSRIVIGADQLLVADLGDGPRMLHQPGTVANAVAQLTALSGTTHLLVNGIVGLRTLDHTTITAIDIHRITMRRFTEADATAYVDRFQPLDCVGAYRIEDDADLVDRVAGDDRSGIIGLPLPTVGRLLEELGWQGSGRAAAGLSQSP